jgi:hypothetical protein
MYKTKESKKIFYDKILVDYIIKSIKLPSDQYNTSFVDIINLPNIFKIGYSGTVNVELPQLDPTFAQPIIDYDEDTNIKYAILNSTIIDDVIINDTSNETIINSYITYEKLKDYSAIIDECGLFKNIDNVEIIYDINSDKIDYNDKWDKENTDYISEGYYSLLKPIESIQKEIDSTKLILGNQYIACHIRRTDALTHDWYKNHTISDDDYIKFIDQYPKELKIYIATDCINTQQKFIDIYGDRMVYKKIEKTTELRQTSLQDAVKDMYVCAGAKYFMRSFGSFSDTIVHLRNIK